MKFGVIILAAGASRRMGSPKALLEWQGETFLRRAVSLYDGLVEAKIVVLGHHAEAVRAALAAEGVMWAVNPDPERGMLSSLRMGLAALPEGLDAFAFTPVDLPAIRRATVEALLGSFQGGILIPRCEGRRGHPLLAEARLAERFQALPADGSPRDVLDATPANYLDVDDPGICRDIDEPADYGRLLAEGAA